MAVKRKGSTVYDKFVRIKTKIRMNFDSRKFDEVDKRIIVATLMYEEGMSIKGISSSFGKSEHLVKYCLNQYPDRYTYDEYFRAKAERIKSIWVSLK